MFQRIIFFAVLLQVSCLQAQQTGGLLESIDAERGGRHWIDQKPAPAKSPEESLACFQIEPGSRLELVAAEPLVIDPVWIDFDHRGRMFAAEYTDYPIGPVKADGTEDTTAPPLSKIVLLEDEDGDGRMDKRTVFAKDLSFCHSFLPLMGGLLVGAQTEIIFLKDTDGDNVADVREVWFDGFTPAHAQMQIGCPVWGIDNWIYLTYAPGKIRCRRPGFETTEPVTLPRQDMRFDPFTMKFESVSGMGQFGNTVDRYGNRFFCTNRNPIMTAMFKESVARRNPFATISPGHTDVGPSGGDTKVFSLVDMKSNWLAHAGTHTSACGVTSYVGNRWDDDFQNSVFVCEPVGHLVTRSIVEQPLNSPALAVRRSREDADFLASTDTWFRPASLRTGPDGALYLADMYRMWVEHPKFLPPEIAAQIDWRAGEDRGRIWRIVPDKTSQRHVAAALPDDTIQLAELLSSPNGWTRQKAQQRLVEVSADPQMRSGQSVDVVLSNLVHGNNRPENASMESSLAEAAVRALNVLASLGALDETTLLEALQHANWRVRKSALQLASPLIHDSSAVQKAVAAAVNDRHPQVAFAAMQTIYDVPTSELSTTVELIRSSFWNDVWFQKAALSVADRHAIWLVEILSQRSALQVAGELSEGSSSDQLLSGLSAVVAAHGQLNEVAELLRMSAATNTSDVDVAAIVLGFEQGAKRNKGPLKYGSFAGLVELPNEDVSKAAAMAQQRILKVVEVVSKHSALPADRAAAMRLLAVVQRASFLNQLPALLNSKESQLIQQAALLVVREFAITDALPVVLQQFETLTPAARKDAAALMLLRPESSLQLLHRMADGSVSAAIIDIDQRLRLLQDRNVQVREIAAQVFGGVVSANRKEVAGTYQAAISMEASKTRGAVVFEKTCSKCHKIDGKGHSVGPDISDTRKRSRDALLYDILDPNRRVDPQFSEYVVVTTDGRTFNGLLVTDTDEQIVLRQAEGREQTISRADIDELQATNKSLMPEGIEKDVSVQQMADLLEYLKAR